MEADVAVIGLGRISLPLALAAVSRVNESVPLFLVEGIKRRLGSSGLRNRKVAVLGLAFKRDSDDDRSSLSHKLVRLLERELADVAIHDPHGTTPTQALPQALRGAEAVVVATNHSAFEEVSALRTILDVAGPDCLLADPWDMWGAGQVFAYAGEVAAMPGAAPSSRRPERRLR